MRSEDPKNDARSVVVTVADQPKALKVLSDCKAFQVATPGWDWATVFGFYKPQKINWKVYRIEGPNGVEFKPLEKIFESLDKVDPNMKELRVTVTSKKAGATKVQNGEVGTKKGAAAAKPKGPVLKLPKTKIQPKKDKTPTPSTPKTPKSKARQGPDSKTPDRKQTNEAGVQSPKPNGNVGATPTSTKKAKTPKSKTPAASATPKIKPESADKGTLVLGLPKKVDEKVPSVGLSFGQPPTGSSSPVPQAPSGTGNPAPGQPKPNKRKGAKDEADPVAKPPAKKKAKAGEGPPLGPNAVTGNAESAPKKAPKKKKGEQGAGAAAGSGAPAPSATSSLAERFAMLSKEADLNIPISRPPTGKSPAAKKPTSAAGVQGITTRFNKFVDPSVAADIVAECKKIKENPETRNFMRQRAAYIYNMVMHVFLNE